MFNRIKDIVGLGVKSTAIKNVEEAKVNMETEKNSSDITDEPLESHRIDHIDFDIDKSKSIDLAGLHVIPFDDGYALDGTQKRPEVEDLLLKEIVRLSSLDSRKLTVEDNALTVTGIFESVNNTYSMVIKSSDIFGKPIYVINSSTYADLSELKLRKRTGSLVAFRVVNTTKDTLFNLKTGEVGAIDKDKIGILINYCRKNNIKLNNIRKEGYLDKEFGPNILKAKVRLVWDYIATKRYKVPNIESIAEKYKMMELIYIDEVRPEEESKCIKKSEQSQKSTDTGIACILDIKYKDSTVGYVIKLIGQSAFMYTTDRLRLNKEVRKDGSTRIVKSTERDYRCEVFNSGMLVLNKKETLGLIQNVTKYKYNNTYDSGRGYNIHNFAVEKVYGNDVIKLTSKVREIDLSESYSTFCSKYSNLPGEVSIILTNIRAFAEYLPEKWFNS